MPGRSTTPFGLMATWLPLCMAACSTDPMLKTQAWSPAGGTRSVREAVQGVPYFLPIAVIPINLKATPASTISTIPSVGGGVHKPSPQAPALPKDARSPPSVPQVNPSGTGAMPKSTSASPAKDSSSSTSQAASTPLLSLTMDTSTVKGAGPAYSLTLTAAAPKFVADATQEYYLSFDMPSSVDSTLNLKVVGGLLSDSSAESVDETAAEAAAVTQTIAAVAQEAARFIGFSEQLAQAKPPQTTSKPTCDLQSATRATNLIPFGAPSTLAPLSDAKPAWRSAPDDSFPHESATSYETDSVISDQAGVQKILVRAVTQPRVAPFSAPDPKTVSINGPLFRDWAPWRLTLIAVPNEAAKKACYVMPTMTETDVMLPNGGSLFTLDTARTPLVDKTVGFSVSNGMLSGYTVKRPSPLLAALKLPLTVLQPILSLPFGAATGATAPSSQLPSTSFTQGGHS